MSKTSRVIIALIASAAMAAGLSGCGSPSGSDTPGSNSGKTYKIASDNAFAPFEYLDASTGKYVGLDMDLLAAIAKDQGFAYTMDNVGFDAAMGAVQSGQADAMIAGMTINDKRKETFDFSDGYFKDGQMLAVATGSTIKALSDLKGTVVAVKASTMGAQYADSIKGQYGFTTQVYEDSPTMYQAVMNGANSACFEDKSVVQWAIKQGDVKLTTVGDVVNPGEYGFATKKGQNAELITMFNKGLANIKASGDYDKILATYGYTA